ncbi:MAG TPA: MFS transporter [Anaerolineales bacterium]|nr:MFS transporter [Anaerolineales bacterium]
MLASIRTHYIDPIRSFNRAARLFLLMMLIYGLIYSGWQLFFNFYILQNGFSRDFLGLVNSLPFAAGLIGGIPLGRLSDRIGRRPALIIGFVFYSIALLMEITFRPPILIAGSAFLSGVFNMLFIISQAPLMVKLSDENNRTMLFSLNYGLQTIAGAVGSLFAGQLPAAFGTLLHISADSATAYQAVLVVTILLGMTALIPLWLMAEPSAPRPVMPGAGLPLDLATGPASTRPAAGLTEMTLKMIAPQVLIGFGAAILIPYMNVFYKYSFNISDSLLGILFSLSSVMIGIGTLIGPRLSTRLGGKVRALVATQSSSLVFLFLMGFAPVLWLSAIGYLMRTALMNMASPLYSAFCMEHTPEHQQGFVNSILNLSWNVGWAVGPFVSGVVQQAYGFAPLFIATAVLYFSAIILQWRFFDRVDHLVPVTV